MTRRSDLMCEDIFGCTHEPETPVIEDDGNEILYWVCRCGRRCAPPPVPEIKPVPPTTPGQRCYEAWAAEVTLSQALVRGMSKESPWAALGPREQAAWEKVAVAGRIACG